MSRVLEGITRNVGPINVMIWPFRAVAVEIPRTVSSSEECPDLAVQGLGGGGHEDCEPGEECPELAVQTVGGDGSQGL